jgi:orotidine-5'-phosphate decarboxylase
VAGPGALEIRAFRPADEESVVLLWLRTALEESPEGARASIADKLAVQPQLFLVGGLDGRVVGTVLAGYDGHRGWLHRVAVDPDFQKRGIGRALVIAAERALEALGCPKLNLQVRGGNEAVLGFYERLGFRVEDRASLGKRLAPRGPVARGSRPPAPPFADRLVARVRALGHPLCAGLDPFAALVPAPFRAGDMSPRDPATAAAIEAFLAAFLDRVGDRVAIVKPQSACFEALGPRGIEVLARTVERARARGLLVLLDAKRGDMVSTAQAYADAYLAPDAPLAVDALTVNPYLGTETLEPYVAHAAAAGRGVFVVVKTSNPGSGELQDREIDGRLVFEEVARSLAPLSARLAGPATGWSGLGAVVGATYPEQAVRVRAALPRSLFLVPGYGAQGGSARDALQGFVRGPDGRFEGGFVSSSRALLYPDPSARTARDWETAVDSALARAIAELSRLTSE